ncbi:type I-E CRISPR-associated protein Cas6/Cse3/CasE [Treponema sp.]
MIASVLSLSRADCKTLKITDPYSIHRVVYSLFPRKDGVTREFLYADKGGTFSERTVLLLSEIEPKLPEFGVLQSKEIKESFLQHSLYGFEVIVNPVKRDNKTGQIVPIRGKEELCQWFLNKASSYGFKVDPGLLTVGDTDIVQFKKDGHTVTLGKAKFIGKLEVIDRDVFIATFKHGLGKAKGFGFGLLQIVPLTKASSNA